VSLGEPQQRMYNGFRNDRVLKNECVNVLLVRVGGGA
jgi:hypothetical protein